MSDDGKCGVHSYSGYDQARVDRMLAAIRAEGMSITGDNPWSVDTHQHGVKLRGTWDQAAGKLSVVVTDKSWVAPCGLIWEKLDPLLR